MIDHPVIEHGSTRTDRWLQRNRLRLAVWIAVVEGLLLILGFVNRWATLFVAVLVVVAYFVVGSRLRPGAARDVAWTAAVSQALVALIPILLIVVSTMALVAVAILGVVALIVLFGDRR